MTRAFLGVTLDGKFGPAMAAELGMRRVAGTRVTSVTPGGPAEAAGIRVGDVILKLDGTPIDDDAHLVNLIGLIEAGRKVSLEIYRDGKTIVLSAVVADRSKYGQLGYACRAFPDPQRELLESGTKRNFQILSPLDFLAEFTQHIPPKGSHSVRYYGWYSNKVRGLREKAAAAEPENPPSPACRTRQDGRGAGGEGAGHPCQPDLGHAYQANLRGRPARLPEVWRAR